jgi:hypothetical protein
MAFSFEQTKILINAVLSAIPSEARKILRTELGGMKSQEPEFYASIIKHGPGMQLTPEEWFDLLSKIPTQLLRDERQLMNKLSESQREKLPPATIG